MIAQEVGDRAGEGTSYGNIGNVFESLGDFKQAINYHKKQLSIAIEVVNRAGKGTAYSNLGRACRWAGDFKQAVDYHQLSLDIIKQVGDRASEGTANGNLGNDYISLGDFEKAVVYHSESLRIAKEVGNKVREGRANGNLGRAYHGLGDFEQAIVFHKQNVNIANEVGDRAGEGRAYGNLGRAYHRLGDFEHALEHHKQHLRIAKEVGDSAGIGTSCGELGSAFEVLRDFTKAMEYHKQHLDIAKKSGDKEGEGTAHYSLGRVFESIGSLHEAVHNFRSSVEIYNSMKALLESECSWKMNFRSIYQDVHTALWRTLIKLDKTDEALCVVEQGRTEFLLDIMKLKYDFGLLPSFSVQPKAAILDIITDVDTQTVFVAFESHTINFWVLCKEYEIYFRQSKIESEDVATFMQCLMKNAEASIYGLVNGSGQENKELTQDETCPLRLLYDTVIGPIADLLHGDGLIIVPDGPLCSAPFAAFVDHHSRYLSESMRIRLIPSLRCLKLITDCPKGYHSETGALLVGDPCMEEVNQKMGRPIYGQSPSARKEVEIVGKILQSAPLTGQQATKDEVLKQMSAVALIHIAANASMDNSKIILAASPTHTSKILKEEDYVLTVEDVQAVKLRASLVVLSFRQSGENVVKSDDVVAIAWAFLAAGARSVLVAHRAIDEEATMELMSSFYKHLVVGKSSSVALYQAMNCLRESEKFGVPKCWAPFILIGDDVTIEFGEK